MASRYTLVRYRPDSLKDEWRNIGIIAWDAAIFCSRFAPDLPEKIETTARVVVGQAMQRLMALTPERRLNADRARVTLEHHDTPYAQIIFRNWVAGSTETAAELIDAVWDTFFGPQGGFGRWQWFPEFRDCEEMATSPDSGEVARIAALERRVLELEARAIWDAHFSLDFDQARERARARLEGAGLLRRSSAPSSGR